MNRLERIQTILNQEDGAQVRDRGYRSCPCEGSRG